jgi:hypothetical protein
MVHVVVFITDNLFSICKLLIFVIGAPPCVYLS